MGKLREVWKLVRLQEVKEGDIFRMQKWCVDYSRMGGVPKVS